MNPHTPSTSYHSAAASVFTVDHGALAPTVDPTRRLPPTPAAGS